MRWATIRTEAGTRAVRVDGDTLVELDAHDVGELLARGGEALETGATHDAATADYAPRRHPPGQDPLPGAQLPEPHPRDGPRAPRSTPRCSPSSARRSSARTTTSSLPPESDAVDWEAELALVIGARVRRAAAAEAAEAIAGFTVANDVSMRDWQYRTLEWLQGKTWEHATPVGPWLVSPDELGGIYPDLAIGCEVDGVVRQASRTSELVFSPVDLVAYVSEFVTLEPGDLLLTGTPAGVGHGMQPARLPRAGQVRAHHHRGHRRAAQPLLPSARRGDMLRQRRVAHMALVTSSRAGPRPARYRVVPEAPPRAESRGPRGAASAPSASSPAPANARWRRPRA